MNTSLSVKKAEWVALLGMVINLLFGFVVLLLAYWSHSEAAFMEGCHLIGGAILWLLVVLHARQKRMALEEQMVTGGDAESRETTLFAEEEQDPFSASTRFKFFEKWVVPIATLLIGLGLLISGSVLFYNFLRQGQAAIIANAPLSAAFLGGCAFFSLLIAKYALGMARHRQWRLLRAGGSYLFSNAVMCFLVAVAISLTKMEIVTPERYLAALVPLLLAFIGIEFMLNLILDVYRPRVPGQEIHPPYDSRFLELCTGSKGILKTAAQTLDYQFGFKVSETWFYQFLEKAIAPLILFQLLSLYMLSCLVIVHPHEQAIIERFGRPLARRVLNPGIHAKWPWPVEKVYHHPVKQLLVINIGADVHQHEKKKHRGHHHGVAPKEFKRYQALLFAKEHSHGSKLTGHRPFLTVHRAKGEKFQTDTVPVNLVDLDFTIHYRIKDLFAYSYRYANARSLIKGIAYQEITLFLASTPLDDILGAARLKIARELQKRIQQHCDEHGLGIDLVFAGICNLHPPVEVANDFEAVISAMEEMQTKILEAEKYQKQVLPVAEAEANKILIEARSYLDSQQKLAAAEAAAFADFLKAYQNGKRIYLERKYLKVLEELLPGKRAYIIDLPGTSREVDILNLEELKADITLMDLNQVKKQE